MRTKRANSTTKGGKNKMFCPKCGSLLRPKKEDDKVVMVCPSCGYRSTEKMELKEKVKKEQAIAVVEKEVETLPLVEERCPKCSFDKAYFWTKQTRASDEPETRFYRCQRCKHVWRDYS